MTNVPELTIAIIGAGTMGRGIAQNVISSGHQAILVDAYPTALESAQTAIEKSLARGVERGSYDSPAAEAALARLRTSSGFASAGAADFVIEAVPENVELKRRVLGELGTLVNATAIVATNTSAIRLDALADVLPDRSRFVGLHYFFPAASNKLLEVVRGPLTSQATYQRACAFAHATDKVALTCQDSNGFIVNRFFAPWLNEAVRLDDSGASRSAVEQAGIDSFGAPLGPFKLMAISKTEIALHATRQLAALGEFYAPAPGLSRQVETGREWTVPDLLEAPPIELVMQLRAAVWFAAGELLDEHICDVAAIELGAAVGLRWRTGPIAAFRADRHIALRSVRDLAQRYQRDVPLSLRAL